MRPIKKDYLKRLKRKSSDKIKEKYLDGFSTEAYATRRNMLFISTALLFLLLTLISEKKSAADTVQLVLLIREPIKAYIFIGGMIAVVLYMIIRFSSYQKIELINKDEFLCQEIISSIAGVEMQFMLKDKIPKLTWHEDMFREFSSSDISNTENLANGKFYVNYTIPEDKWEKLRIDRNIFEQDLKDIGINPESNGTYFYFKYEINVPSEALLLYQVVRDDIIKINWHLFWEFRFPIIYSYIAISVSTIWLLYPKIKGMLLL